MPTSRQTQPAVLLFVAISVIALLVSVGVINNIQQNKRVAPSDSYQQEDEYQNVAGTVSSPFQFKLVAPTTQLRTGDTFAVDFQMSTADGSALNATVAELYINFDPAVLEAKSIVESNEVLALQKNTNNSSGTASVDIARYGSGSFPANQTLVTFNFYVKSATSGSTAVNLNSATRIGSGTATLAGESIGAQVTFPATRAIFGGTPANFPGRLEAENFDIGANGTTYYDNTNGNEGSLYRTGIDADIKRDPKGTGYALGYNRGGEWWEYTVNVAATGNYDFLVATHSVYSGRTVKLKLDGQDIGIVDVPVTSGWDVHGQTAVHNIDLAAGQHILRIEMGDQDSADIDYVVVKNLAPNCKGDYDADGTISASDFMIFAQNYKTDSVNCKYDILSPVEGGNKICRLDSIDFGLFAQSYKVSKACAFE